MNVKISKLQIAIIISVGALLSFGFAWVVVDAVIPNGAAGNLAIFISIGVIATAAYSFATLKSLTTKIKKKLATKIDD